MIWSKYAILKIKSGYSCNNHMMMMWKVGSCSLDGSYSRTVLYSPLYLRHPFSISVFEVVIDDIWLLTCLVMIWFYNHTTTWDYYDTFKASFLHISVWNDHYPEWTRHALGDIMTIWWRYEPTTITGLDVLDWMGHPSNLPSKQVHWGQRHHRHHH